MEENLTYTQAVAELDKIVAFMQNDKCDVDSLAASTRRAAQLLNICREKLVATEKELESVLATLQPAPAGR